MTGIGMAGIFGGGAWGPGNVLGGFGAGFGSPFGGALIAHGMPYGMAGDFIDGGFFHNLRRPAARSRQQVRIGKKHLHLSTANTNAIPSFAPLRAVTTEEEADTKASAPWRLRLEEEEK